MATNSFPSDFKPRITVEKSMAGTPLQPKQPSHYAYCEKNEDPIKEQEEYVILFDSQDTAVSIIFTVVAAGENTFRIKDPDSFKPVKSTVKFNKMDYQQLKENPDSEFEIGDRISYEWIVHHCTYKVTLTF